MGMNTTINLEMDYLTLSHELRIPLAAILGTAELLGTEALSRAQQAEVSVIQEAGNRLLKMVDKILAGQVAGNTAHHFCDANIMKEAV